MASRRASTSLCFSLHLIWHSRWRNLVSSLLLWLLAVRVSVFHILWLLPQEYQPYDLSVYEFQSLFWLCLSRKSSGFWPPAVRVPVLWYNLSPCEFRSFNMTSCSASTGLSIRPLAVRVPVVQYDFYQSVNPTSHCASSSRSIWPLAMRVPVSYFISPAGVFSPIQPEGFIIGIVLSHKSTLPQE